MNPLEEELVELRALVRRMASAASSYNSRIYQVGFEPEIVQYLTDEEIRRNSERPSEADARALAQRDALAEQVEAVRALAELPMEPQDPEDNGDRDYAAGYNAALAQVWRMIQETK